MNIETFFDPVTFTLTHVVFDPKTCDAVVIDPVLDYDALSSRTSTASVARVETFLKEKKLNLHYVLETHAHADHISGAQYLKRRFDARVAIGAAIVDVQKVFSGVFDLGPGFSTDGSQFDRLLADGEEIAAGSLQIDVIATPGHTPACVTYRVGDAVFTGDALFIEDYGTGRCDFPSGSADALYTSVHERLYALPDATRVFVGHDYQPNGRTLRWETTIGTSKAANIQVRATTSRAEYVARRCERDAKLPAPRLLFPSIQVNIEAGRLPKPHANGARYLTVPLDTKNKTEEDGDARCSGRQPMTVLYSQAPLSSGGYRLVQPGQVVAAGDKVRVIDVREPAEYGGELGHIAAAELVPVGALEQVAKNWDHEQEIVLVCRSGARSGRAATLLVSMGFRHVMNMVGGMAAWNAAQLPLQIDAAAEMTKRKGR